MKTIDFENNQNNKLACNSFTHLNFDSKLNIGELVSISLKGKFLSFAEIISKKRFKVGEINESISRINSDLSREQFIRFLLIKNPKLKNIEIENQTIYFYLLKKRVKY